MANENPVERRKKIKFRKLFQRYKPFIIGGLLLAVLCLVTALLIYQIKGQEEEVAWHKFADFLMTLAQTIVGAGLIGGGIGGSLNFIFEEIKQDEEEAKERLKVYQEAKEKRKVFLWEMQNKLKTAYDNVELARVLIKSHRSGKTYGEQIRNRIMPSLISLEDIRSGLLLVEDAQIKKNLDYLRVSLNYMIAYLSVLIEEFEANYLEISNLQNYQDALATRLRTLYTEITEGNLDMKKKKEVLKSGKLGFEPTEVPSQIEIVWQEMCKLDYIRDFIGELRDGKGKKSLYNQYFLQHYNHCNKILKAKDSDINHRLGASAPFKANLEELGRLEEKRNSDAPITNRDNLARIIMEKELHFDFETHGMKRDGS